MSALSNRRLRRLNLRQRKKRHVGEFQELLFRADARFHDALSPEAFEAWVHEFLSLMEGGVQAGGSWRHTGFTVETEHAVLPVCQDRDLGVTGG